MLGWGTAKRFCPKQGKGYIGSEDRACWKEFSTTHSGFKEAGCGMVAYEKNTTETHIEPERKAWIWYTCKKCIENRWCLLCTTELISNHCAKDNFIDPSVFWEFPILALCLRAWYLNYGNMARVKSYGEVRELASISDWAGAVAIEDSMDYGECRPFWSFSQSKQ